MTDAPLPTIEVRTLSLAAAERMLDAGVRIASTRGLTPCIAVVGQSGHLLAFRRMDGCRPFSSDVAVAKARSSVAMGKPSSVFAKAVDGGEPSVLSVPGLTPLRGGLPVIIDGEVVGAIGVSGISATGDEELAEQILTEVGCA